MHLKSARYERKERLRRNPCDKTLAPELSSSLVANPFLVCLLLQGLLVKSTAVDHSVAVYFVPVTTGVHSVRLRQVSALTVK